VSSLPSKLFFRIGEVAGLVGVEPHVLRYWEREFRSIRPTKSAKGQRVYSRRDVENLLRVRDLLYCDGFTIAGAKKRLQRGSESDADATEASDSLREDALETPTAGEPTAGEPTAGEPTAGEIDDIEADKDDGFPSEPASGPRAHGGAHISGMASAGASSARAKLSALRAEVERFLDELESPLPDRADERA
jgi:DNA-binding transcriptional MerR regulator